MADIQPDRRRLKWVVGALWIVVAVGYVLFARSRGLGALEAADELRSVLADHWWGPALFILAYVLRPVVFFPASVLTILGGLAFGPAWGVIFTVLAANASMAASYFVGRFFGSERTLARFPAVFDGLTDRARSAPLVSTLLMRLLYLPFDLVGYIAGFLRLRFWSYAAGSFLGTLPGTVAFVGFGASIERLDQGRPSFDLRVLLASLALAIAGGVLSRWLGKSQTSKQDGALS